MAAVLSPPYTISSFPQSTSNSKLPFRRTHFSLLQNPQILTKSKSFLSYNDFSHPIRSEISATQSRSDEILEGIGKEESLLTSDAKPVKFLIWVLLWASVSVGIYAFSGDAKAAAAIAADSIRASGFGVRVANALRASGWPDEAVVFALATLPVIELRGAIPVGYWLQLKPVALTVLSVLGNMVPVPFIILYLRKIATFLTGKNETAAKFLDMLFKRAKEKAGPVEEFQWLGLMLFVAVPFPRDWGLDGGHHRLYTGHGFLGWCLCKFCRGCFRRPSGQLAGQSRTQVRHCNGCDPVLDLVFHVELPSSSQEVFDCMI